MSCVRIRFLHTEAFRLSAIYAGVFALSVLVLGSIVLVITDRAFRDEMVQFSSADIATIQAGYNGAGIGEAREVIEQSMAAPGTSDYFLLQQGGTRIAGNLPVMAPQTGTVSLPGTSPGHDVLGVGAFLAPGLYAFAGRDLYRVHKAQEHIIQTLAWLFAAALLLAVLGGALVSRSFLRRSDAMGRACRAIMDGDLKARIPVRGTQDELDRLAGTINEMLDRIAALMENLRQVSNDIAHDLRTPVSQLRQGLEWAKDGPGSGHAQALEAAIERTDGILALFAAMLRIAEIEGGKRRTAFANLDLGALLHHMHELFAPVAEAAGHSLAVQVTRRAEVRGDRALLIQLLSNLIENAILHTPSGTHIIMSLTQIHDQPAMTVADDGPGVPADEHAKLFQRLYRREASRTTPGYGLGLSTAQAIAELHGAQISVVSGSPGLGIRVLFPPPRKPSES
jgi:signal transduction histidine kinase